MTQRDRIRAALCHVPEHDRGLWLRMGMAIKSELGDEGFDLWDEWSQQDESYNAKNARIVWKSINGNGRVTIGTLYYEAKRHGFQFTDENCPQPPTLVELEAQRCAAAEQSAQAEAEEQARHEAAAQRAVTILNAATVGPATHPYALKKRVSLGPLVKRGAWTQRGWPDAVLVPIYGADGRVWSIEAINTDGNKDSLKDGRKTGGFHPFGKVRGASRVFVAEGVANAAVGAEVDKSPAVAAMGKSNLGHVARTVRELAPDAEIIILADNDLKPPKEAHEAAVAVGGLVVIPELDGRKCDLWDAWSEHGIEAVERAIANAKPPAMGEHGPDTENAPGGKAKPSVDIQAVITRLAKLPSLDYDRCRQAEAEQLGVRVTTLDSEVRKARAAKAKQSEQPEHKDRAKPECPDLEHQDPLVLIDEAIKGLGYGGDRKLPKLLYLCCTSRLLSFSAGSMLAHGQAVGAPSSGKNFAVDTALALLPEESYLKIDAGSPKALIYSGEDLQHRIVVFTEADSLPISDGGGRSLADGDSRSTAASALRNLASDGYLSYDIVEKDAETGQFVTRRIRKDGPTLLLTTTINAIGGQMGTRLWEIPVKETDEQICAALSARVTIELTRQRSIPGDLALYQEYLQSKAPWDVVVPFAKELCDGLIYTGMNPRILRDFQRILSLIKSVAVLRHKRRCLDGEGRLIATLEDYEAVRDVLNDSYTATVSDGLTDDVRLVVKTVEKMRKGGMLTVTYDGVAKEVGWNDMRVRRKAKVAMTHGWLVNKQEKPRQPANLDLGADMPESRGLPTGISLQNRCGRVDASVDARNGAGSSVNRGANIDNTTSTPDNGVNGVNKPDVDAQANKNGPSTRQQHFRGGRCGQHIDGEDDAGITEAWSARI